MESYVDEEDLLGFHIFVAELELLVNGGEKDKKSIDNISLIELLQKLLVSIDHSDNQKVKQYQKRCENVLLDVLFRGFTCYEVI